MKSGILLINKEKNMTSRDVDNIISKKLNTKKVGHTGTLDPIATGLLIICVNKATKLIELLTCDDKEYIAKVKIGIKTDTLDITGNVLIDKANCVINSSDLDNVLKSFIGTYNQEVPIYSAVKVNGKKLYEYARNNKEVELPKRLVTIKNIELLNYNNDNFTFKVQVSKGTYIRSLIRDIGEKLDIPMTMQELTRTKINSYSLSMAKNAIDITYDDVIAVEDFLNLPKIIVSGEIEKRILNGVKLDIYNDYEMVMFMNECNKLLAIYKKNEKNQMCMYKLF